MEIKEITEVDIVDSFEDRNTKILFLEKDENGREITITKLHSVNFVGDNLFYPNVLAFSGVDGCLYNPIREKTMSLKTIEVSNNISITIPKTKLVCVNPVFYFIYNTDNYFHFVYDTLPYLISFKEIKKKIPKIKLLMNYANSQMFSFYKFVLEFLDLFGVNKEDILLVDGETSYSSVFISNSFTHDFDSNLPPRKEVYELFQKLVNTHKSSFTNTKPKKIYISRRSWIHNDFSNIGTNYTTRRKLENEDGLVNLLKLKGFEEVFTENMSTIEKLDLFSNAEMVVGCIGGGLCNVLFSPKETKLITIASPIFLDINNRFKYCLDQTNNTYFTDTKHTENSYFKKYMRINCPSRKIVGEITSVNENTIDVSYTEEKVSGWNAQNEFKTITLDKNICFKLDDGLNSSWFMNLESFSMNFC
jgi:hypothetical protein